MKKRVVLVFGGKSAEHDVSLSSASNIFNAADKQQFDLILLGIDKSGRWYLNLNYDTGNINLSTNNFFDEAAEVCLRVVDGKASVLEIERFSVLETFDVVFPIIHGTFGEDGTLQGFLKSFDMPFVGPDILGSAICMDKEITKRLARDHQIPIADFIALRKSEINSISFEFVIEKLGLPVFIKPCNAGSSVGVSKVIDSTSFAAAIQTAFQYDSRILIEEAVVGKEVECAVMGNDMPAASLIGEIEPVADFYTFEAKYQNPDGARLKIPASMSADLADSLKGMAIKAFNATRCEGMARVDFFLRPDHTFVLNEINTLPGFTALSMYPALWAQSGVAYSELISTLIKLAIERKERDSVLIT